MKFTQKHLKNINIDVLLLVLVLLENLIMILLLKNLIMTLGITIRSWLIARNKKNTKSMFFTFTF